MIKKVKYCYDIGDSAAKEIVDTAIGELEELKESLTQDQVVVSQKPKILGDGNYKTIIK